MRTVILLLILITDYSMPEVDGLELTRRVRALYPTIPVLMVSGSMPPMERKADEAGRFAFLTKPFHFDELLHKVRSLLDAIAPFPNETSRREPG